MQFIPSTWTTYAVDADGSGTADPHDIDDAALAAGRYLCANNHNLATPQGWWDAILNYNGVQTYAQNVFNAANDYGCAAEPEAVNTVSCTWWTLSRSRT
jgi:membrane-bound lytic murein transglycosylase B